MSKNQETIKIGDEEFAKKDVIFDHYLDKYVAKNTNPIIIKGVVNINNDGSLVMGDFSPALDNTQLITEDNQFIVMSSSVFNKKELRHLFVEGFDGIYRSRPNTNFTSSLYYLEVSDGYKKSLPYSIGKKEIDNIREYLNLLDIKSSPEAKTLHKIMNGLSVGVELETSEGIIPMNVLAETGLQPLRDGSIGGVEYVTIPLSSAEDFQLLINATNAIQKYTTNNGTCALHFHFGNVPRNIEFLTTLWQVVSVIQNELYAMQPPYKMLNWGIKRKSYSKPLPQSVTGKINEHESVQSNFNYIYEYLSMGQSFNSMNNNIDNIKSHPADPSGTHKWNINTRYHILNLIPIIFGNKATVEFRISEITSNSTMIINELIIFSLIVNYVKQNYKSLIKNIKRNNLLTLRDVVKGSVIGSGISSYYDNICGYINEKEGIIANHYRNGKIHFEENVTCYPILNSIADTVQSTVKDKNKALSLLLNNPNVYTLKRLRSQNSSGLYEALTGRAIPNTEPKYINIDFYNTFTNGSSTYRVFGVNVVTSNQKVSVNTDLFNYFRIGVNGFMSHYTSPRQRNAIRDVLNSRSETSASVLTCPVRIELFTRLVANCLGNRTTLGKALRRSFLRLRDYVSTHVGTINTLKIVNGELMVCTTDQNGNDRTVVPLTGLLSYSRVNLELLMITLDVLEQQEGGNPIVAIRRSISGGILIDSTSIPPFMNSSPTIKMFMRLINAVRIVLNDMNITNENIADITERLLNNLDGDQAALEINYLVELKRLTTSVISRIRGFNEVFTTNSLADHGEN